MAHRVAHTAPADRPETSTPTTAEAAGVPATTRERILDVALDLFIRKGYAETSLREIAEALDISKAAIYYHFESKQHILAALHQRLHVLEAGLRPVLEAGTEAGITWEQFIDALIGIALQNRRLFAFHARNQEAIAELHHGTGLEKHGPPPESHLEERILELLQDPAAPLEQRIRRMASVGAIAGVLLAGGAFGDVPDAALETALRHVAHDVLGDRPG